MNIDLTPELEEFGRQELASGRYATWCARRYGAWRKGTAFPVPNWITFARTFAMAKKAGRLNHGMWGRSSG